MKYLKVLKKSAIICIIGVLGACSFTSLNIKTISVEPIKYQSPQEEDKGNTLVTIKIEPETDVWQRVRSGFVMTSGKSLNKSTQEQVNRLLKNRQYLDIVTERARPYLHYIVSELDKRNMPMEIALLPVVESGFKPHVYSNSGAAGLWQFMPATGKMFGLEQNGWYDGRRNIVASTDAALDYLQKLHGYFGDWQLALAAYNAGEGRVGRAIEKNKKAGKPTDFWSLGLPAETTAYVPKLLAISHLVSQANHYGLILRPIENKPVFTVVDVGSQIDLALAAKLAGITSDELYQFNPGYNYFATQPDGPHELVIPVEKSENFKRNLAALPIKNRMQWQRHKIKKGESLGVIAMQYKTTVSALQQTNKLSSSNIRTGRHLMIPMSEPRGVNYKGQDQFAMDGEEEKPKKGKKIIHLVIEGDTWWDLARTYDVGLSQLAAWNGKVPKDTLRLGQKLEVWATRSHSGTSITKTVNYEIKRGDSLWRISQRFKVSIAQLREWNGLSIRSLLKPGQKLTLYVDV